MIGEPVALTIRRNFERPAAALLKAFRGAPNGFVTDAYNGQGYLHHGIKPIAAAMDAFLRRAKSMQFWNEAETQARGGVRYLD